MPTQQPFSYLFYIVFCPFAPFLCFWDISLFALWKFTRFLIYVVSFAVFLGQYSLFFNACLFQQPFSYLFYIAFSLCFFPFAFETFCPLPFPLLLKHFALCPLEVCPLFSYSRLFHSLSFGGSLRSFSISVCFIQYLFVSTVVSLPFLYCFLPLCLLPFAIWAFRPLPFEILPVVFLFSVVSFAVFWGQSSLFFNICLFQQSFSYLFYIVFCPLPLSFAFETFRPLPFSILQTVFCPLPFTSPFCCFLSFLCVEFTFCITFDGNLLQKFVTRQKV